MRVSPTNQLAIRAACEAPELTLCCVSDIARRIQLFTCFQKVESGFWGRVGRLGTALGFFLRFTSERQLPPATGSCDLALRKNQAALSRTEFPGWLKWGKIFWFSS